MYAVIHHISGEEYVAELNETGAIANAAGPLHYSEIPVALTGDFDGDPSLVEDLTHWIETGAATAK